MRYKKFKNAEIEVSQLAVGTWAIGGQNYGKVDKNEAICAIRRMIEKGVNLIETFDKMFIEIENDITDCLTDEEKESFKNILIKINNNLK